ncbi:hypothetical protein Kpol_543p14 [Vanderwaltozyma polyspora DSM 70294]|uniref:Mitochondrial distribution and morphology protein 32 n=1 Tax=Vanderwaltozyma polyspora (strain ATCC 22028 / DSM 70294 / BCRC 21397 / CBS 2163 / NBRC 10782 / NRRL Y-8283 / UCD 57-17) TaxID=436907 RepID=MDM32_VANPO|nr:uncharacterized protein Kpol_543p14 [Vanderwaltozyma polyspora DSM 70294]A7THL9.1 RecName: Full=Mitochondrial distribution and morphology protein 32; Flags: Precursor [Vanderwaltozyma polyspora DSM 70294]EDO18185.1 hypothetical protein Kpol_543p14 [Vanderwaltozyma polyspora DSM 70294]
MAGLLPRAYGGVLRRSYIYLGSQCSNSVSRLTVGSTFRLVRMKSWGTSKFHTNGSPVLNEIKKISKSNGITIINPLVNKVTTNNVSTSSNGKAAVAAATAATAVSLGSTGQDDALSRNTDFLHIQNILLQKNQDRMNKQKLLSEATNFYERFKINTKWLLIRGNRPFSADEIGTLFSWIILSQILWIILGTTTFVSILLIIFNTVFAKEMVGNVVGKLLNIFLDGIDVKFQDALVPEWRKGCIRFNNVQLRTHPLQASEPENINDYNELVNNMIEFDLKLHQIELSLSLKKWLLGNGLIQDLTIMGMRGNITVTPVSLENKIDDNQRVNLIDWFSNPYYHLGNVKVTDSSIILHDNQLSKDFKVSIYNLDMPQLRFQWIINDFLSSNVVDGSINHSLFNIHKRQHKLAYIKDLENDLSDWKRITRIRLDSIDVKKLGLNNSNAFNWMDDGQLDIIADVMLPNEQENEPDFDFTRNKKEHMSKSNNKYVVLDLKFRFKDLKAIFPDRAPRLSNGEEILSLDELKQIILFINRKYDLYHSYANSSYKNTLWDAPNIAINKAKSFPVTTVFQSKKDFSNEDSDEEDRKLKKQIIRFHDDISTPNNELVLSCKVVKNINELKNMVLFWETGIYDSLSMELYIDLMKMVEEWEYKKKTNWMTDWGSSVASQLIIVGFGAMV